MNWVIKEMLGVREEEIAVGLVSRETKMGRVVGAGEVLKMVVTDDTEVLVVVMNMCVYKQWCMCVSG